MFMAVLLYIANDNSSRQYERIMPRECPPGVFALLGTHLGAADRRASDAARSISRIASGAQKHVTAAPP